MSGGYLRPYHEVDSAGVVVSVQMLNDEQAREAGLLKVDGEPRAPKRASRKTTRARVDADSVDDLADAAAKAAAAGETPAAE